MKNTGVLSFILALSLPGCTERHAPAESGPADAPVTALEAISNPCEDAMNTYETSQCLDEVLSNAEQRRLTYLAKALELNENRESVATAIRASSSAFETYLRAECGAVNEEWLDGGGTARPLFVLGCQINLIDQRTQTIWTNWLIPMADNTPPFLPEPEPTL